MPRYGMVIDLLRCIGCHGCQMACKAENATPPGITFARVAFQEVGKFPNMAKIMLPLVCMHCDDPACVDACPTGATQKRQDGIVFIDQDKCIGCKYCMMACPYAARYYHDSPSGYFGAQGLTEDEEKGYKKHRLDVVMKCDYCARRIDAGCAKGLTPGVDREATPACVINCMAKARYFGDLDDPNSEVARLVSTGVAFQMNPEIGTNPKTYYLPAVRIIQVATGSAAPLEAKRWK